jgi:hypothetical protein
MYTVVTNAGDVGGRDEDIIDVSPSDDDDDEDEDDGVGKDVDEHVDENVDEDDEDIDEADDYDSDTTVVQGYDDYFDDEPELSGKYLLSYILDNVSYYILLNIIYFIFRRFRR